MAVTVVQAVHGNDPTAQTPSVAFTVSATTPGNALIVVSSLITKTRTLSSITDSASNAGWVAIDGGGGSTSASALMWWNPNPGASITSFQFNYSGTTKVQMTFLEVSGLGTTVNAHHSTQHTTAAANAVEAVTTTVPAWILSSFSAVTGASGVSTPFAFQSTWNGAGQGLSLDHASDQEAAGGTFTSTWTNTSEVSSTVIAGFTLAAGNQNETPPAATAAGHFGTCSWCSTQVLLRPSSLPRSLLAHLCRASLLRWRSLQLQRRLQLRFRPSR